MKKEIIHSLTKNFEKSAYKTKEGIEFWLARDLQILLGYEKWSNFIAVIDKAKISCQANNQQVPHHFADAGKMIELPNTATRELSDIMLTRYACYLIAQNGDPRKQEIAFAQSYFALQTRRAELIEQKILESERVQARNKLAETEKELSKVIFEQTGSDKNFALIRSKGDQALFSKTTAQMKEKWQVKENKALADFMPTILLKAKDFATEITIFNSREHKMKNENTISKEHIANNKTVRNTLISRGITPENLPPEEDVKKIERKLKSEKKKTLKNDDNFNNFKD